MKTGRTSHLKQIPFDSAAETSLFVIFIRLLITTFTDLYLD